MSDVTKSQVRDMYKGIFTAVAAVATVAMAIQNPGKTLLLVVSGCILAGINQEEKDEQKAEARKQDVSENAAPKEEPANDRPVEPQEQQRQDDVEETVSFKVEGQE